MVCLCASILVQTKLERGAANGLAHKVAEQYNYFRVRSQHAAVREAGGREGALVGLRGHRLLVARRGVVLRAVHGALCAADIFVTPPWTLASGRMGRLAYVLGCETKIVQGWPFHRNSYQSPKVGP